MHTHAQPASPLFADRARLHRRRAGGGWHPRADSADHALSAPGGVSLRTQLAPLLQMAAHKPLVRRLPDKLPGRPRTPSARKGPDPLCPVADVSALGDIRPLQLVAARQPTADRNGGHDPSPADPDLPPVHKRNPAAGAGAPRPSGVVAGFSLRPAWRTAEIGPGLKPGATGIALLSGVVAGFPTGRCAVSLRPRWRTPEIERAKARGCRRAGGP